MVKRGLAILGILGLILVAVCSPTVAAHGGEDHGEAPPVVVVQSQTNVKVAKTSTAEVLVTYPTPQPTAEIPFLIFISDLKTNAPISEVQISLTSSALAKGATTSATLPAVAIAPGIYQAMLSFAAAGPHNLALKLQGQGIDAQITVTGVIVAEATIITKSNILQQLPPLWILGVSAIGLVTLLAGYAWRQRATRASPRLAN
jgi:hypothetical protein